MKKYKMISLKSLIILAFFVSIFAAAPIGITRQGVSSRVTFASDDTIDYKSERKAYKDEVKGAKREFRKAIKSARKEMAVRLKSAGSVSQKKQIRKEFNSGVVEARKIMDQMLKDARDKFRS